MTIAYLGIGSNVGQRADFCRRAVGDLEADDSISVRSVSSLYETSPLGGPPQRSFINCVVEVDTDLDPHALLDKCKKVESALGREPSGMRWGPRTVDVDVLLYGDEKIGDADLQIPHPRMSERRFVLVPLLEIAPEAADPGGARYADLVAEAEGDVELLEPFSGPASGRE